MKPAPAPNVPGNTPGQRLSNAIKPVVQELRDGLMLSRITRAGGRYSCPRMLDGSPSAGAYPEHEITGSRGYFGNRESVADKRQR